MSQYAIGEDFESAIQTMREYVNEVQIEVATVFDDFYHVAVIEHPWKVLYDTALHLEESYNEQVLGAVKSAINNWADDEGSYVSLTKRFKMGDDAVAEAQRQQTQIVEEIANIPEITQLSESVPDFLNTNFELEAVKTKLEEISNSAKKLNDIAEEKNNTLIGLSEDNESIKTIVNVGTTYGTSIAQFVSKVTEEISTFLSEQIDSMEQQNEAAVDQARQEAEKFNQSIDDALTSMNGFLDDLFG